VYWTPPQESENSCYDGEDGQYQSNRTLLRAGNGNLLSIRLNAETKGDYSQPGLMPGPYLEQIDLPSAYFAPLFPSLSLLSAESSYSEALSDSDQHFRLQEFLSFLPFSSKNLRNLWSVAQAFRRLCRFASSSSKSFRTASGVTPMCDSVQREPLFLVKMEQPLMYRCRVRG
jgi:hypothetical protein